MRVALKGAAASAVWAAARPHEILTGECPFQELALSRSLARRWGGERGGKGVFEGGERGGGGEAALIFQTAISCLTNSPT